MVSPVAPFATAASLSLMVLLLPPIQRQRS
jgi:hypothetical protein